jgi:hypothetical protein
MADGGIHSFIAQFELEDDVVNLVTSLDRWTLLFRENSRDVKIKKARQSLGFRSA